MSRVYKTTIIEQKEVAEKTWEVSLKRPSDFSFQAGQYIQVNVPKLLYPDYKGPSRVFSIVSSPLDQEKISVAFRDTNSGFKRTLEELPMNAPVNIEGPHGFFTLPQSSARPLVFLAGGIGIAPCLSMINFATEKKLAQPITLLYANRDKESAAYFDTLSSLQKQNLHFTIKNKFGFVDADFLKSTTKISPDAVWYIVGPPMMVANTKEMLLHLAVDENRIFIEEFIGYE